MKLDHCANYNLQVYVVLDVLGGLQEDRSYFKNSANY